jgi:hypothetical protein
VGRPSTPEVERDMVVMIDSDEIESANMWGAGGEGGSNFARCNAPPPWSSQATVFPQAQRLPLWAHHCTLLYAVMAPRLAEQGTEWLLGVIPDGNDHCRYLAKLRLSAPLYTQP